MAFRMTSNSFKSSTTPSSLQRSDVAAGEVSRLRVDDDVVIGRYRQKSHSFVRRLGTRTVKWLAEKTIGVPPSLSLTSFRALRDSEAANTFQPQTWQAMVELGWSGILVPEEYGGSDLGFLTFSLILEQLGRQLTPSPLFASSLVRSAAIKGNVTLPSARSSPIFLPSESVLPS